MGLWFVEEVRALCGLRVLHIRWLDLRRLPRKDLDLDRLLLSCVFFLGWW
jgi:hypothetical protein